MRDQRDRRQGLVPVYTREGRGKSTSRDAPAELVEFADLVSEVRKRNHPFDRGIKAQAGLEL